MRRKKKVKKKYLSPEADITEWEAKDVFLENSGEPVEDLDDERNWTSNY
ncbi:MAG: hypothetical protein IJX91_02325 [Clostridia bacterium]|nr:hypothetical protein [Clostridia bacterium]